MPATLGTEIKPTYYRTENGLSRWLSVNQIYVVNDEPDDAIDMAPAMIHAWRNSPMPVQTGIDYRFIVRAAEPVREMQPNFCREEGIALMNQLVDKWRRLNILTEAAKTGIHQALTTTSNTMLITVISSVVARGFAGGVLGLSAGASAGIATNAGIWLTVKKSLLAGSYGFGNGAVKGFVWGSRLGLYVGLSFGALAGAFAAYIQYESLENLKKVEQLLVDCLTVYVEFAVLQEINAVRARRNIQGIQQKFEELLPTEAKRLNTPVHQALWEANNLVDAAF